MRIPTSYGLAALVLAGAVFAQGPPSEPAPPALRQMAITIDDLPVAPPQRHSTVEQTAITDRIITTLLRHDVPAIGFVNENKLEVEGVVEPARVDLLRRWLDAGFELGNHGYGHLDLHRVDPERWMADVLRGERILRPLVKDLDERMPRYFRHPFLRTGRSLEIKRRTTEFLAQHGYRIAPVTIDNQEWIFGRAYVDAGDDQAKRTRIGEAYIAYMLDMVAYYESQTLAIVGEPIPHTLLIHTYALNADWLDTLLRALVTRGYTFISLDQALQHPVYGSEDTFTGSGGITWLHRWAITRGMPGSTFAGEPAIPEWLE